MSDGFGAGEIYNGYWGTGVAGWHVTAELYPNVRRFLIDSVRGLRVLDFGGGDGERYGEVVMKHASSYTVADVSEDILRLRKGQGAAVVRLSDLGAHESSFDVALCLEVLEHLVDPVGAVREIRRSLRPGGKAVLSVPNAFSLVNRLRMLVGRQPSSGVGVSLVGRNYLAPHVRLFDVSSFVGCVREGGLTPVSLYTDRTDAWRWSAEGPEKLRGLNLKSRSSLRASTLIMECSRSV